MGQSLRIYIDYFTLQILKVLIATFETLRNKLKKWETLRSKSGDWP